MYVNMLVVLLCFEGSTYSWLLNDFFHNTTYVDIYYSLLFLTHWFLYDTYPEIICLYKDSFAIM